ncbi:MAG: energy transducer TonB [Deltaproteobacteria bacterium]|nr:MAG: energy transducer TonB [Deltaproteobacteria bacterium]
MELLERSSMPSATSPCEACSYASEGQTASFAALSRTVTRSDPCYSADALNAGVEGWMVVRCTLTTEGRVTRCAIIRDLPYMGANVIQALEQRRYAPAMRNGEPIEVNYTFKLHLTMP